MNTVHRRTEIINILIIRRHTTANELAQEFGVSIRTIQYDIQALTPVYPIYTKQGENGGIFIREDYAKEYAVSIGLSLDSTATECWDNPISANPNRSGIKSDIESRLNRYKNSEGFTAVWIWAEKLSDTEYNIYIGYC